MEGSVKASGVDEAAGVGEAKGARVVDGIVERGTNDIVERGTAVFVGIACCVSASVVLTVDMAVSIIAASLTVGVGWKLLQEASITAARNKKINVLPKMFILPVPLMFYKETLNASRPFPGCAVPVG